MGYDRSLWDFQLIQGKRREVNKGSIFLGGDFGSGFVDLFLCGGGLDLGLFSDRFGLGFCDAFLDWVGS